MKDVRTVTTVFLMMILAALPGCGTKKEKTQAAPQNAAQGQQAQPAGAAAAVASPKDAADAAAANARVLAQLKAGDFAGIYKESSAGFREVGKEKDFVGLGKMSRQKTGPIKKSEEVSHNVKPGNFYVYTHHVLYENVKSELRLTFARSKDGKMELTAINQKDIPN